MEQNIYYEDYKIDKKRETLERQITQKDIAIHTNQTGETFPCNIDKDKREKFKQTNTYENLMISISNRKATNVINELAFLYKYDQIKSVNVNLIFSIATGMAKNRENSSYFTYEYNNIKFLSPVFVNDTIKVNITILEKKDHETLERKGIVTEKIEVENQNGEIVMVCNHILLCDKKESRDI